MEMKKKKESAKEMFLKGETEVKKLAKIFDGEKRSSPLVLGYT
jgi:hypothetical protein